MAARFLNYLLTPFLTYVLTREAYGEMSLVYAMIPFFNVLFNHGMETTYFRFSNQQADQNKVFNVVSLSLFITTLLLSLLMYAGKDLLTGVLKLEDHPQLIVWAIWIIALDTITVIPFARLRNEGKPLKYALIRVSGISINIIAVLFFYALLPKLASENPNSFWGRLYNPHMGVGYVFIANIIQSACTLLLLSPQLLQIKFEWDSKLWKQMLIYGLPIMVAGLAGMINETFDRIMLGWLSTAGSEDAIRAEIGVYSACYKLSIFITLFIQAFRMGAEPFFFKQAGGTQAPHTYAKVMRYFFITLCLMFLFIVLYIDLWKYFIDKKMWAGLSVVPMLLLANMCLGIYYNLSVWYKISGNTKPGMIITFLGAFVTLVLNYLLIPKWGYIGCAWVTFICYAFMMVLCWYWGQKVYPVPYEIPRLSRYFMLMLLTYFANLFLAQYLPWYISGSLLFALYIAYIIHREKEMVRNLPVIGRLFRK